MVSKEVKEDNLAPEMKSFIGNGERFSDLSKIHKEIFYFSRERELQLLAKVH